MSWWPLPLLTHLQVSRSRQITILGAVKPGPVFILVVVLSLQKTDNQRDSWSSLTVPILREPEHARIWISVDKMIYIHCSADDTRLQPTPLPNPTSKMNFSPAILFFLVFGTCIQAAALPERGETFRTPQPRQMYSCENSEGEQAPPPLLLCPPVGCSYGSCLCDGF